MNSDAHEGPLPGPQPTWRPHHIFAVATAAVLILAGAGVGFAILLGHHGGHTSATTANTSPAGTVTPGGHSHTTAPAPTAAGTRAPSAATLDAVARQVTSGDTHTVEDAFTGTPTLAADQIASLHTITGLHVDPASIRIAQDGIVTATFIGTRAGQTVTDLVILSAGTGTTASGPGADTWQIVSGTR